MRDVWTVEELGLNRRSDWTFDVAERREMHAATSRR
jgi:hypothetical protein